MISKVLVISDQTLPSVFADIREPSILEWIQAQTSDGTFCKKSDTEKDSEIITERLTPGNERGAIYLIILTFVD